MRVTFCGSLDIHRPDYQNIEKNLKALIKTMAIAHSDFVLRNIDNIPNPEIIPVDTIIGEALASLQATNPNKPVNVTIFCEPGTHPNPPANLKYSPFTASTTNRVQFYQELLALVDLVVGIGGQQGLLRLSISCEWLGKPILILPGSGGTSELLWEELFVKSYQVANLPSKLKNELRQLPYINQPLIDYSSTTYSTIKKFYRAASKNKKPLDQAIINSNNITIATLRKSIQRFSIGLWLLLISAFISIISTSYYIGSLHIFDSSSRSSSNTGTPP